MRKQPTTIAKSTTSGLWDSARLADYLGCSQRHLFNLRKRGLPSYRLGDMVRFDIEQVTHWLNSGSPTQNSNLRERQLADLASETNDNATCAAADIFREFPSNP